MTYQPLTITSPVALATPRPYPVLLDSALSDVLDVVGWDKLSVRLADGTPLAHAREGTSDVVHFQLPTVSIGANIFNFWADAGTAENKAGVPSDDAVAYWPMGDGASPMVDWTAAVQAQAAGGITFGASGRFGPCVVGDGTGYLEFPVGTFGPRLHGASCAAWSGWVYQAAAASSEMVYVAFAGYRPMLSVRLNGNGTITVSARSQNADTDQVFSPTAKITYGEWNHIAAWADLANQELCVSINGAPHESKAVTFGSPTYVYTAASYHDYIGMNVSGAYKLVGSVDQFALRTAAPTDDEIAFDYACGAGSMNSWGALVSGSAVPPAHLFDLVGGGL